MSRVGVFTLFKKIVTSSVDNLGNPRPVFIGVLRDANPDSKSIKGIETLVKYMLETGFLSDESKAYLKSDEKMVTIVENMYPKARKYDMEGLLKKFSNKVYYDQTKFKRIVNLEELSDILYNGKSPNGMLYRLREELSKLGESSELRDKLMIDIPKKEMCTTCNNDDFKEILLTLYPYTLGMRKHIIDKLGKDKIGYFNYLLLGIGLSKQDMVNRETLIKMLNNELIIDNIGNVIDIT